MGQPYIGEIRLFAGNFAPAGWNLCDGTLLQISQFDALFNLIGTTYGGNGSTTFGLPDLRSRVPVHMGSGYFTGQMAGVEQVTLTTAQIPSHNHALNASANGGSATTPANGMALATANVTNNTVSAYAPPPKTVSLLPSAIGNTGGSQPHDNRQPYLALNFIIALYGVYPSQN